MSSEWLPLETGRHQDHIIAHVLGATALGYFEFDQAAHILLDIGFFWTIFIDGEMALVLQSLAIKEFELEADLKSALSEDVQALQSGVRDNDDLSCLVRAPAGCLIKEVGVYAREESRRILITGEEASLEIIGSLSSGEILIIPEPAESGRA
ncbi:MAG TPA: hypothetical protein VEV81_08360 [Pyrinomonadaceae bacterium]|nr:hypothetical protein [Pyrinomonadaceae bacterium]